MMTAKRKAKRKPAAKREPLKTAPDYGTPCVHCGERYGHKITNSYPNGNKRRVCGSCGKPFISRRLKEITD